MATLPSLPRRSTAAHVRVGGWVRAALAMLAVLALRLVPLPVLAPLDSLPPERIAVQADASHPIDAPGTTFPGSAYFFAEGAFAPDPQTGGDPVVTTVEPGRTDPHILQIEAGPAALSMPLRGASILDNARALQCLTNAIYYEAGNEPEEGQRAVAQVVLNRIASGRWPASVCGTVYQDGARADRGCQFTFSCDGSMARTPAAEAWTRARRVAQRALAGEVFAPAGLATFYHTLAVRPAWSGKVRPVAVIGAHIFYRLPGEAGAPAAYRMRYAGRETAQPGPYAFIAPPAPLPPPPGPDADWPLLANPPASAVPAPVASMRTAAPSPLLLPSPAPLLPVVPVARGWTPLPKPVASDEPGLPESTIRPEYRNTGRPIH